MSWAKELRKIGLPWWLSGKESTSSAGDMGAIREDPIRRAATEPARHNYWSPRAATKIPRTTIKTQHTKNKEISIF